MKRPIAVLLIAQMAAVMPLSMLAQIVGPLPVIDLAAIAKLVSEIAVLQQQFNQLVTTYNKITQQYNQMVYQAQNLRNLGRFRLTASPWTGTLAGNVYGTTAAWITAINSGAASATAWNNTVLHAPAYGAAMNNIPASQQGRVKTDFGTLELQDGAGTATLGLLGGVRLNGARNDAVLNSLESEILNESPDDQTEAALLDKISAGQMVSVRNQSDTNKLLVAQAELQLVNLKEKRDAAAAALQNEIAFRTTGIDTLRSQHAGFNDAMMSFRMP